MRVEELFPKCRVDPCPLGGSGEHSHILSKQQQVLEAPERVVAQVGGYGCVAPETLIGGVPIAECSGLIVKTLFGPSSSSAPFRKGRTSLYQITTRSGREVVATLDHQFLTHNGWRPLGSLAVGVCIAVGEDEREQLATGEEEGSQDYCSDSLRLCGGQLLPVQVAVRDRWRQFAMTAFASTPRLAWPVHLSIDGSVDHVCSDYRGEPARMTGLVVPSPRILEEIAQSLYRSDRLEIEGQPGPVLGEQAGIGTSDLDHDLGRRTCPYPPIYQAWDSIVKISFVKEGDFYDVSVPGPEHYLAQGIWHHNSAKTIAAMVLGHLLSSHVPGNLGIVVRRSLPKLRDSTQRIFLEVLDRSKADVEFREMRDGWPGRIIYRDTGSEVTFRETKDLGRFLGPEYGWFAVDEAQEEPELTFKNLMGRLRLPRANRFLKAMLMTNPPRRGHWIQKLFPKEGSWTREVDVEGKMVKISFRMIRSKTSDNPFLDAEYIAQLKLTHTADELRGVLTGEYRTDYDGKPVYRPPFNHGFHVGSFPVAKATVVRGWDFGYHHPVVTFHQMLRCPKQRVHWRILRELLPQDLDFKDLYGKVREYGEAWFPEHSRYMFIDAGDSAGAAVSDKGPGPIIELAKPPYNLQFRYTAIRDVDPGIRFIRDLFKVKCECGHYLLEIDRECPEVIEMFLGGYHFPKDRYGQLKPDAKPTKDGYYDNIADSVRYVGWNLYRVARQDQGFLAELEKWQGPSESDTLVVNPSDFGWMGDWAHNPTAEVWEEAYHEAKIMGRR